MIKLKDIVREIMTNALPPPPPPAIVQQLPSVNIHKIADAIYYAEGGKKTRYPYGITPKDSKIKTKNVSHARQICLNTVSRVYREWISEGNPGHFIDYLSKTYCPPNANRWSHNVKDIMTKQHK